MALLLTRLRSHPGARRFLTRLRADLLPGLSLLLWAVLLPRLSPLLGLNPLLLGLRSLLGLHSLLPWLRSLLRLNSLLLGLRPLLTVLRLRSSLAAGLRCDLRCLI